MRKWKNFKLKRIFAGILAVILFIASIPIGNLVTKKVMAEDSVADTSATDEYCSWSIKVNDSEDTNLPIIGATVTVKAMRPNSVNNQGTEQQEITVESAGGEQNAETTTAATEETTAATEETTAATEETTVATEETTAATEETTAATEETTVATEETTVATEETTVATATEITDSKSISVKTDKNGKVKLKESDYENLKSALNQAGDYLEFTASKDGYGYNNGVVNISGSIADTDDVTISMKPQVTGVSITTNSELKYTGAAIQLINRVTVLDGTTGYVAVSDKNEMSAINFPNESNSTSYSSIIGTNAGDYYVYLKAEKKENEVTTTVIKEYVVTIAKADVEFYFSDENAKNSSESNPVKFSWNLKNSVYETNITNNVSYSIDPVSYSIDPKDDANKPTINNASGKLTFDENCIGDQVYKVTAKLEEQDNYNSAECSYYFKVVKAKFNFEKPKVTLNYGVTEYTQTIKEKVTDVTYSINIDNYNDKTNAPASIDSGNGKIKFEKQPDFLMKGGLGTITVTATKDNYETATYELSFNTTPETVEHYTITIGENSSGFNSNEFYQEVTLTPEAGYEISIDGSNFTSESNKSIVINESKNVRLYYKYKKDGVITLGPTFSCKIDKNAPEISDVKIIGDNKVDTKNNKYYGKSPLQLTFKLSDNEEGSGINENSIEINGKQDAAYDEGQYSYTITEDFNDKIKISVTDNVGNNTTKYVGIKDSEVNVVDDKDSAITFITDNTDPVIDNVKISKTTSEDKTSNSYKMIFNVTEDNIDSLDVKYKKSSDEDNDSNWTSVKKENISITQNNDTNNYEIILDSLKLNDKYDFKIICTDKSGNSAEKEVNAFFFDNEKPVIEGSLTVGKKELKNEEKTSSIPTINLTISDNGSLINTDSLFNTDNLSVGVDNVSDEIKGKIEGKINTVLKTPANWTSNDGKYTINKSLYSDSDYNGDIKDCKITITYTDASGLVSDAFERTFTVDKTAPKVEIEYNPSENIVERIFNNIKKWFFPNNQNKVSVKVTATDSTTAIDRISYKLKDSDSYTDITTITNENNGSYSYTFELPDNYKGVIYIKAKDECGNECETYTKSGNEKVQIITDNTQPKFSFNSNTDEVTYSSSDIDVTLEISDASLDDTNPSDFKKDLFSGEDTNLVNKNLKFDVKYTPFTNNNTENNNSVDINDIRDAIKSAEWTVDGETKAYKATISQLLKEPGKYVITASYTDYSGNVSNEVEKIFYIDKENPEIGVSVKVDGNEDAEYKENNIYKNATISSEIKIDKAAAFDASDMVCILKVTDAFGTTIYDSTDEKLANKEENAKFKAIVDKIKNTSNWENNSGVNLSHSISIEFPKDYTYDFSVNYKDKSGRMASTSNVNKKFTIIADTKPSITGIGCTDGTYNIVKENGSNQIIYIKNNVKNVTVTAYVKPGAAPIKSISYSLDGKNYIDIPNTNISANLEKTLYVAKFDVNTEKEFSGELSIKASDIAEKTSDVGDNKSKIVVDKTLANLSSSYTPDKIVTDKNSGTINYDSNVTGTYTIDEANFYKEDAHLVIKYTPFNDSETTVYDGNNISWTKKDGKYVYSYNFNKEGKYSVELTYTDKSGNVSNPVKDTFYIDKTPAKVDINAQNNKHYNADVDVTFKVTEANFNKEDVTVDATFTPFNGSGRDISSAVKSELDKNWKQSSTDMSVRTASYKFTNEGTYVISMSYKDKSGNVSGTVTKTFRIDKTAPVTSVELSNLDGNVKDGQYSHKEVTATIKITEAGEFKASDVKLNMSAKNSANVESVSKLKNDFASYVKDSSNWKEGSSAAEHICTFTMPEEYRYGFSVDYTDVTGWSAAKVSRNYIYDNTNPNGLNISYSSNDRNVKTIDGQNYIFFKNNVDKITVTLTAYDETAGVQYFEYSLDNGKNYKKLTDIKYDGTKAAASFEIGAQYKGKILFRVVDRGNLESNSDDGNVIVLDTVAPQINIDYTTGGEVYNNTYYKEDRKAVVTVTETNFYPENVNLVINRTDNNDITSQVQNDYASGYNDHDFSKGPWKSIGDNKYQCEINFNEDADYNYSISVSDYSGSSDSKSDAFTVDKINPVIDVTFYNNDARNKNQFKANRTAQIVVTEHNFNADYVNTTVTAVDKNNNPVETYKYAEYLKNPSNWVKEGNTYTAYITFDIEANYTFHIGCYDMSGRVNADANGNLYVNCGDSVAPTEFTIDKTFPTGSIKIGDWTQSRNGETWDHLLSSTSFGLWSQNSVNVEFTCDDTLSNVEYMRYYKSDRALTPAEILTLADTDWQNANTFTVVPDERFIIYARVMDNAGNEIYLSSDGVVVDNTKPTGGDEAVPKITVTTQDTNEIYNTDVSFDLYALEPSTGNKGDVISGINNVTYSVVNNSDGTITQQDTLYSFNNDAPSAADLLKEWSGSILVDRNLNNSNDVDVNVSVTDNAGNMSTATKKIKIDTTLPTISVTYDNNSGDTSFGEKTYFKESRTATIDITERNFNEADAEMILTDANGVNPGISGWTTIPGSSANEDDTIHRTTITYDVDSDYTFDMNFKDMVGNEASKDGIYGDSLAPQQFTIDKTVPVISVSYDNSDAVNGNYYKNARTATVTIEEHNFDPSRIVSTITAEGGTGSAPSLSDWSSSGDTNTASVTYSGDTLYSFALQYTDMAGNEAVPYDNESFYVDVTVPELSINSVNNESAYKDDVVAPEIIFSDTYYDSIQITLSGAKTGGYSVDDMGSYSVGDTGGSFSFRNIDKDDIYTLSATVVDKAGNSTESSVSFSVNREGSTYDMSEETKFLNGNFVTEAGDIILYEVNPDELVSHTVTIFKNNKTITLKEGEDYSVVLSGGSGEWYRYEYRIFAKNFTDDGVYRVSVHSEDKAGNVAENTIDTKDEDISFVVDKTKPNIVSINMISEKNYEEDSVTALFNISDNIKLAKVEIYLDDELAGSWDADSIKEISDNNDNFEVVIGSSNKKRKLTVVATDAAGNVSEDVIENFIVSRDAMVLYFNNKPLFYGSIAGVVALAGAAATLIVFKRKKKVAIK